MNDCVNAEIRDRLPDLLHERLDQGVRASVMAHVESCADCQAELALLRSVNEMLTRATPRVDVSTIVKALPSPPAVRRRWSTWRLAAAAAVIAVAGTSVMVIANRRTTNAPIATMVATAKTTDSVGAESLSASTPSASPSPEQVVASQPSTAPSRGAQGSEAAGEPGLAMTGRLGELTDDELEQLLREIDEMEAVPLSEPEPVVMPITTRRPPSPMGR
jgi:hypothetical protein